MTQALRELRAAARRLGRAVGTTALSIVILGIGIGASSGMYTVVREVLTRPLPFDTPEQLFVLRASRDGREAQPFSVPEFNDLKRLATRLSDVTAHTTWTWTIEGLGDPQRIDGAAVSANYFSVLGSEAQEGVLTRSGRPDESDAVVVLSHRLWTEALAGDPNAVGRSLRMGGKAHTVVGVLPEDFEDPWGSALVYQLGPEWLQTSTSRSNRDLGLIARRAAAGSTEEARIELRRIAERLARVHPEANHGWSIDLEPVRDAILGESERAVWVLFATSGLLLLLALANVANLLLSRTIERGREFYTRIAVGASEWQLLAELVAESLIVGGLGCLLGLGVALGTTEVLAGIAAGVVPRVRSLSPDAGMLAFALCAGSVAVGLTAALPWLSIRREVGAQRFRRTNKARSPAATTNLRSGLLGAQVALAVVLLTTATLMIRTLWALTGVDTGIDTDAVVTVRVSPSPAHYPGPAAVSTYLAAIASDIRALPGVGAVGAINVVLLSGRSTAAWVAAGADAPPSPLAEVRTVLPGYFHASGVSLLAGRLPDMNDTPEGSLVTLLNRTLADELFRDRRPVGQTIQFEGSTRRVIGIVEDVWDAGPSATAPPAVYIPHAQDLAPWRYRTMSLVVRLLPEREPPDVGAVVRAYDARVPISGIESMSQIASRHTAPARLRAALITLLAGVGIGLTSTGVAGLMAQFVARRRQEMAIRRALGARTAQLAGRVLKTVLSVAGAGVAVGTALSIPLMDTMSNLLFQVSPRDAPTLIGSAGTVLLVCLASSGIAALRATRVEARAALQQH